MGSRYGRSFVRVLVVLMVVLALSVSGLAQSSGVTLTISTWWLGIQGLDEHMRKLADDFMAENPGVNIELVNFGWGEYLDKLTVMHAGGTAPDIYFVDQYWVGDIIANGMALDLDPYIERDGVDLSEFRPGGLGLFQSWWSDYSTYGLPIFASSYDIWANLNMFHNAGLDAPPRNWTTDEFMEYCRRLTDDLNGDGTPDQWCMANPFHMFKTMVYNFGGTYIEDGKFVMNSPEAIEGATFPIRVQQSTSGVAPQGQDAFLQLQAAMTTEGPNPIHPEVDYIILEQPLAERQVKNILTHGYMISSATPHKAEAWSSSSLWPSEPAPSFGRYTAQSLPATTVTCGTCGLSRKERANVDRKDTVPLTDQPEGFEPTLPGWLQIHDEWAAVFGEALLGQSDYAINLASKIDGWQSRLDDFLERVGR